MIENTLYRALKSHLEEDISTAELLYKQVVSNNIYNSLIYYLLGCIANANQDTILAEKYLAKALDLNCNIEFKTDFSSKNDVILLLFMTMTSQNNIYTIESWEKALNLKPLLSYTFINVSKSYLEGNDISNAIRVCNQGLELYPDNLDLMLNKGSALLRSACIEEGWRYQEARINLINHHQLKFNPDDKPKYDGTQDIKNKTIYVYSSAGFGDTIYFVRYLPLLVKKGANVIVKAQQALKDLFEQSDLQAEFIDENVDDSTIKFDYQLPFMSMGNAFNTTLNDIPFANFYLKADKQKVKTFHDKYLNKGDFKIGIFWQGSSAQRAFTPDKFLPVNEMQNVQLFSFQKGDNAEPSAFMDLDKKIINIGNSFNDFSDTAAAIENMDLMIGCDTSVANLAAAMGKPVWIVLPYFCGWRWGLYNESTPWYSSARLFRQKTANDWDEVFSRLYQKLEEYIKI